MVAITELSDTAFEVQTPAGGGQVEYWGTTLVIYVDQPERPSLVEGSVRFAAASRPPGGPVERADGQVSDEAWEVAMAVLAAFDDDPDSARRLVRARAARAAMVAERLDALEGWARMMADQAEGLRADIAVWRDELAAITGDTSVPLPGTDRAGNRARERYPELFGGRRH